MYGYFGTPGVLLCSDMDELDSSQQTSIGNEGSVIGVEVHNAQWILTLFVLIQILVFLPDSVWRGDPQNIY